MALITSPVTIEGSDLGLFLKPIEEFPSLQALGFETMFGQRDGYMYFHTEKDKITKKRTDCGYPTPSAGATITRKLLSPVPLQAFDSQCADVFDDTILAEARRVGTAAGDLTGTALQELLLYIFRPVVYRDMLRIGLLGDTSLVGDADYSQLDGWYKKLKAQVPSGQSYGAVTDTAINTTNIRATLKAIWDLQTLRLRQTPNAEKAFYVTRSVYDAWEEYLTTLPYLESSKSQVINGMPALSYKGIELIPMDIVDQYVADVDGTSGVANTPNRIVYAKKNQTGIMIDSPAAGKEFDFWYSKDQDKNLMDSRYRLDVQLGYTEYFVIAGF